MRILGWLSITICFSVSAWPSYAQQHEFYQKNFGDLIYSVAVVPKNFKLKIIPIATQGVSELIKSKKCGGYSITGGFTDKMASKGWLFVDGVEIAKIERRRKKDGGILFVGNGSVQLVRYRDRKSLKKVSGDKIQSYPILIVENKIDGKLRDRRLGNRVALGLLKDERIILAMVHDRNVKGSTATTSGDFAKTILQIVDHDIQWMINFDGGASAFLTTPDTVIAPSNGLVSSFLCLE